jgi:7-carboxy-7-deazaguanine synthase
VIRCKLYQNIDVKSVDGFGFQEQKIQNSALTQNVELHCGKLIEMKMAKYLKKRIGKEMKLKVNDLFNSISGEYSIYGQGITTTFLRLAECNLKCFYCDTKHENYVKWDLETYLEHIEKKYVKTNNLCITGGEPLLQIKQVEEIITHFWNVWIETNGTIDFTSLIGKVPLVIDYKMHILKGNLPFMFNMLTRKDCVKFVVNDKKDIKMAINVQHRISKVCTPKFAYSVVYEKDRNNLYQFILDELGKNNLSGILNVQIHKYLGLK